MIQRQILAGTFSYTWDLSCCRDHANAVANDIIIYRLETDINITSVWGSGDLSKDKPLGFSDVRVKVHLESNVTKFMHIIKRTCLKAENSLKTLWDEKFSSYLKAQDSFCKISS